MSLHGDHEHGAAWRRRQRRLRMHWRHEQLTLQMLLATYEHHAAPRGQMKARSGRWERVVLHGHVPDHPTPQAAGTEYFSLDVEDVPAAGSRPDRLFAVSGPQNRVQRRTVQQIVDTAPLPIFDDPAPQMVEQLHDVLRFFRALSPDPEQVIEVPTILLRQFASRSWWNSWWKCLRSYPGPCCSRCWSRPLTFQLLIVVVELVEVFKIFSQFRVPQRLLRFLLNTLVKGFFAPFPHPKKVRRSPARWMNICPGTSAHPRPRLMRHNMLLVMTSGCRSGPMTNRTPGTVWSRRQYGACRLALGRPGCECKKASSFTSRLRRCSIRCRARSDLSMVSRAAQVHVHGLVTPPVLGAVGVHGLADRVRDGVLHGVLREIRPCEHAVQVPASVQMTVVVPRFQFIDRVGHCSFATVTGFLHVQTVQKTVVKRLCRSLARSFFPVFATTGAMVRQCCPVEVPLLCGPDSACGAPAVAVHRQSSTFQL